MKENYRPYNPAELGIVPGSKRVVLMSGNNSVALVITAVLLLRETGCHLPVQFMYIKSQISQEGLDAVESYNITTIDISSRINHNDWSGLTARSGSAKVDAILSSSFEQVLFLDPDNYVLRNPEFLFNTKTFRRYVYSPVSMIFYFE